MTDDERQGLLMSDFTQVPSIILQMQKVLKNGNTYACLQFIWAKTGGWGRNEDTIAYSQFANDKRYGTGLSIKTIQRSVEKLSEIGVITMTPSFNNMHEFTLNIPKIKELVGDEAKSNSPSLEDTSQVNLSTSQVNLSTSKDYLSNKPSQIDLHTRTTTQELLHNNITLEPEKEKPAEKPKTKPKKRKHDIPSEFTVTEAQQKKCDEYGINSQDLVNGFDDFHSSRGNQFVDWSKAFNTWLNNHIKFEKLKPINQQVNQNERYQPANQSNNQQYDTSTTAGYAAKLDADAAAYFASRT